MNPLNKITERLFKDNLNLAYILRQIEKTELQLEDYDWDQCIADQTKEYGAEAAPKICGYIKSKYGN
tara:strand:- start:16 stop:216 length:201 start_codon:yes stop_codon:yes gene_type:complete